MIKKTAVLLVSLFLGVGLRAAVQMSAWLSYQTQHEETLELYGQKFISINVFAYDFDTNDNLRPARPWVDDALARQMANKRPGRPVYITIVNDIESDPPQQHNGPLIERILSDPNLRARHIQQIVALSAKADGVEIDYESLLAGTRPFFTAFIQELRAALPAGKLLAVDCQPKTDNRDGPRGQVFDWPAIAPHVDAVKVMTYYYSFGSSEPGPSAPLDKMAEMTRLAKSQIPEEKLHIVLTQFGWDWPEDGAGSFLSFEEAMGLAQTHGVVPVRDAESQMLRFKYREGGNEHEVWFPDATGLRAQVDLIQSLGVNKIAVWELGVGDPAFWEWAAANTVNPVEPPPGPVLNPTPALISLNPSGATVGDAPVALSVRGTGFNNLSQVQWNGIGRATRFVSETELSVDITTADLSVPGTAAVRVFNPLPGGGESASLTFAVRPVAATPFLLSLSPSGRTAGNGGFVLSVEGLNFVSGSVLRWNGSDRPTTFESATRLTALISENDARTPGDVPITVMNPSGEGGESPESIFTLRPAPTVIGVSPGSVRRGDPDFLLTVIGTNFQSGVEVTWRDTRKIAAVLSPTRLQVTIRASEIPPPGTMGVGLVTPDGYQSNTKTVLVLDAVPGTTNPPPGGAFPNPWLGPRAGSRPMTFLNVAPGSEVAIFNMVPRRVKTIREDRGNAIWDMTDDGGEQVASGYYIYVISDSSGSKKKGKLAVVR